MRVAYFAESTLPHTDGVSRTLDRLFCHMIRSRHGIRIYSPFAPPVQSAWADHVRVVPSIPFVFYNAYRISVPRAEDWTEDLDLFEPDLIHATSPTPAGFFALEYARKRGIPVVTSYHTHFVHYFKYYGFGFAENLGWSILQSFHNQGNLTFAPTPQVIQELQAKGFRNLRVWSRGIDANDFHPSFRDEDTRRSLGGGAETPLLLFVGRLVKEKDLDDLAVAAEILRGRKRRFRLVLAGEGPYRKEAERRMPEARFVGVLHGHNLARVMASCDLMAFPSTTETFGNVVQEAFASGLPAVVAGKGGVVDLVQAGVNGWVARPNDPLSFADALDRLLVDPAFRRRMGAQAREGSSQLGWDAVLSRLVSDYESIIGEVRGYPQAA